SDIKDSDIEIRAEYLDDFEIGYACSSKNVNASANVYYMNYTDQLVPTGELNSTGYLIRENVEKSYRLGIEIAVDYTPVKWFTVGAHGTFSQNKIKGLKLADDTVKDTKISYSPDMVAGASVAFRPVTALTLNMICRYVSDQYMSNSNIKESKLDSYFVSDFAAAYDFKKGKIMPACTLRGTVNNLFNAMYVSNGAMDGTDAYYFAQAGINFMLALDIKF
ncbi:MAG: TonB-dependent receptor, partial [Flavobacteriales bacterium]|nr:TonB-dependent receptor [Flavobacteriales bacterium]